MARKSFLITYPDRSKKHVDSLERDSLLLAKLIRHLEGNRYEFAGEVCTLHSFADLERIRPQFQPRNPLRKFLEGSFVFEHAGRKKFERLETAEALEFRLPKMLERLAEVAA